jgi:hypothetical protein
MSDLDASKFPEDIRAKADAIMAGIDKYEGACWFDIAEAILAERIRCLNWVSAYGHQPANATSDPVYEGIESGRFAYHD